MSLVSGIVVYLITWWLVLFAVLPWGAAPPEQIDKGHAPSAPARPRLRMKFLVTTGVAALVWLAIFVTVESGVISFREMAAQ